MNMMFNRCCRYGMTSLALVLAFAPAAQAKQRVLQLAEDSAQTRRLTAAQGPLASSPPSRVCEPNAKWIRLNFNDLTLRSYDTLVLQSSGGDRYVFSGNRWNDRNFSARALRGSCVDIQPYFGSADSHYTVDSFQFGTQALEATTVVVAGAGDICDSTGTKCQGTSDQIVAINPTAVFTAGDNAYSNGTLSEYNARYAPTWGRFKTLTSPSPGNHDYNTTGASGYFDYFNGTGNQTGPAGDRSKGYYSYDVGDWHFVALNTMSGGTVATAQIDWLKADLAATAKPCVAAYFHHPLLSVGNYTGYSQVKPFYDELYAAHADLVLVGHDHNYQRYKKMDGNKVAKADGLRQILVGTGGRAFYGIIGSSSLLEASNDNTHGVLKLTLTATGYTADFVPSDGTFTDTVTDTCNAKGGATNAPPVANFSFATSGLTANFTDGSTDSDGTIASRSWNFGDGSTSTATSPSHVYATAGTYNVTLTATDNQGATGTVTKAVTVAATGTQTYSNTTDYPVADFATVDSPITVAGRTGNAPGNASVTVNIVHTYIGDLKVDLVAPDGSLYNIHNRTGKSTDNISKTVTLNLSSEPLDGTWKLRVSDNARTDTGYIDSWSITF
ncbi:proprotein convertase P-domain-containing protein [Lysobacter terrae]